MKKMVSLIIVVTMLFSCFTAFANEALFATFTQNYKSYIGDVTVSFTLDKPLLIIDKIVEEMEDNEDFDPSDFINFKNMVESLFGAESTAQVKLSSSENFKKIQLSMEQTGTLPLNLNKNLATVTEYKNGMWMDMDLTDEENPKLKMIMNNPFMDKYLVMDLSEEAPEELKDIAQLYNTLFAPEKMDEINGKTLELVKKYATIIKAGKVYTLKFDDMSAKMFLCDVLEYSFKMAGLEETFAEVVEGIKYFAENNIIFGDKGFEIKIKLGYDGTISSTSISMPFDLNVYDIAENYGENVDGMDREDFFVSFTFNAVANYKNINKAVKVEFPVLTDENSINLNDMLNSATPETDYEYLPEENAYRFYYVAVEGYPILKNNDCLVPLRALCENMVYTDEDFIAFENGVAKITMPEESDAPFKTLEVTEFSTKVVKDGEIITLTTPVEEINGTIVLNAEFLFKVLGLRVESANISYYDEGIETGIYIVSAMF